jgi:Asp-tRNA(Asn)/Glu-tRNA(Gln) amidotransferase A subunit family amidase
VRSLAEILADGRHHPAVDGVLRRAEAAASRDTEDTRLIHQRRAALREYVLTEMSRLGVDVLTYPPIRRVAAPIGEPQGGSNCQLSAATGLPAISIPAGFTPAGLPVGLELLARDFQEAALLSIAYSYEQTMLPRRPPASTPALSR